MPRRVAFSSAVALVAALCSGRASAQEAKPPQPEGGNAPDQPSPQGAPAPEPQPPTGAVALLGLQIRGDAPPELRALLESSIRRGLVAAGQETISLEEVARALAEEPDLVDCVSTTCLQRIGEVTGANRFLRASVEAVGAAYSFQLDLLAPGDEGTEEKRIEESCPVCTLTEVSDLLAETATRLFTDERLPVPVVIATRPQGADLRIDDEPVGAAPFEGTLAPGPHRVAALLPGHLASQQTIEVRTAGEPQRFEVILTEEPPPTQPIRRPYRTWKWVAGGGAAASLITGIVLVAIDGSGTCSGGDRECPERYDTLLPGIVGIGLGLGLGGTSGWMFLRDHADSTPEKIGRKSMAVAPLPGGVMGHLLLRF